MKEEEKQTINSLASHIICTPLARCWTTLRDIVMIGLCCSLAVALSLQSLRGGYGTMREKEISS